MKQDPFRTAPVVFASAAAMLELVSLMVARCAGEADQDRDGVVATGGPPGSVAENVDTVDVCALLDEGVVSAAVEEGVEAAVTPSSGWAAGQCTWTGESGAVLFSVSVGTEASLQDASDGLGTGAQARFEAYHAELAAREDAQDLPEIGDGAVAGPTGMAAYAGATYLEAVNLGVSQETLTELMTQMVANL